MVKPADMPEGLRAAWDELKRRTQAHRYGEAYELFKYFPDMLKHVDYEDASCYYMWLAEELDGTKNIPLFTEAIKARFGESKLERIESATGISMLIQADAAVRRKRSQN